MLLVLGSCANQDRPTGVARRPLAAPEAPRRVSLSLPAESSRPGAVVARGSWGSAPGQLGRKEEASRPGPMAIAIGPAGELLVLDQVNRRICRYSADGRLAGLIPIESEAAEDLAVVGDRIWVLSYQPGSDHGYRLTEHRRSGARLQELRLSGSLDLVTGLFASGEELYVEERHEEQLLVIRGSLAIGDSPARRERVLGRPDPARPGTRLLLGREGKRATVSRVYPGRFTSVVLEVELPLPVIAFEELLSDGGGGLYLSLLLAELGPDGDWRDPRRVLVAAPADAPPRVLPLATARAADTRRPIAVGPDGAVHELELAEEGFTIRRWSPERGGAR